MSLETLNGFEYLANFLKVLLNQLNFIKFRINGFKEKADGNYYY